MSFIENNGYKIYYEILGDINSKHTVCFFNGVMASTESWRYQTTLLEKLGYKIILHDFAGQLKSDKPQGPYTLKQHADDFYALLDHLKVDKIHLIGTSYGGEVAQRFALDYPSTIQSLSLINTVSELSPKLVYHANLWKKLSTEKKGANLITGLLPEIYGNTFIKNNPDVIALIVKKYETFPEDYFTGLIYLLDTFINDVNLTQELKNIKAPTLIICSQEDIVKPTKFSKIINREIKNSEYFEIPDCGHVSFIEKPNEVNSLLLGFISKNCI